jgi:hypothetical protein
MNPQSVLDTLAEEGIRIELADSNLRYYSPSPLDPEQENLLREHKEGLLRLLEARRVSDLPEAPKMPNNPQRFQRFQRYPSFGDGHLCKGNGHLWENEVIPSSDAIRHFRNWWWYQFNHGADDAEFNAGSVEYAGGLLPILRDLTWPDFKVEAVGAILKLKRVCERHYPVSDAPDEGA